MAWVKAKDSEHWLNKTNGDGASTKGMTGKTHTTETKEKMSLKAKGKPKSPEHILKIRQSKLGSKIKPSSEEKKRKISLANLGKRRTPEQKKRIREARWGVK